MACRLAGAEPLSEPMLFIYWTPRNKLQWNFNRNSYIFIQENPFENVVWKMAAILSRSQCVNWHPCRCSIIKEINIFSKKIQIFAVLFTQKNNNFFESDNKDQILKQHFLEKYSMIAILMRNILPLTNSVVFSLRYHNVLWFTQDSNDYFARPPQTVFTRCHFWPSGIVIACVCVSVHVCVYQSLACLNDNSSAVQARITKFG